MATLYIHWNHPGIQEDPDPLTCLGPMMIAQVCLSLGKVSTQGGSDAH